MKTIRQRREKVADEYMASGYGRGTNTRNVYKIDGFFYAYHPEYARQAFRELTGELKGYVPVNQGKIGDKFFYTECDPSRDPEEYRHHIPAKE